VLFSDRVLLPSWAEAGDEVAPDAVSCRIRFFRRVPPNLFASVMGTGIVATTSARFDWVSHHFVAFGRVIWILAAAWLLALIVGLTGSWILHRNAALSLLRDPVVLPFYGTVPMALLTVGSGSLLLAPDMIGDVAVWLGVALWSTGTALGVTTAIALPVRAVVSGGADVHALPSWMLPVVPPMVSATTGAGVLEQIPVSQFRTAFLAGCCGLFGMGLIVALMTLAVVYWRLVCLGTPGLNATPTIWIPLGVIGQSMAAANLLAMHSASPRLPVYPALPDLRGAGVMFGIVMLGFAVFWIAFASAVTTHGIRRGAPFTVSWWSVIFPLGATTLGISALAEASDSGLLRVSAFGLYVALIGAWAVVAIRSIRRGQLAWWR